MSKEVNFEETVDRLIAENRHLHAVIDEMHHALHHYVDMNRLSLGGAVAYLVRHKKLLDEVQGLLKKASRKPEMANQVLHEIEVLLERAD